MKNYLILPAALTALMFAGPTAAQIDAMDIDELLERVRQGSARDNQAEPRVYGPSSKIRDNRNGFCKKHVTSGRRRNGAAIGWRRRSSRTSCSLPT